MNFPHVFTHFENDYQMDFILFGVGDIKYI